MMKITKYLTTALKEGMHYCVDFDCAVVKTGKIVGKGEPDNTFFGNLKDANDFYLNAVRYWREQPAKPRIVSLSQYDPKHDTWDHIESQLVH